MPFKFRDTHLHPANQVHIAPGFWAQQAVGRGKAVRMKKRVLLHFCEAFPSLCRYPGTTKTWPTCDLQGQGVCFATLKNSSEDVHALQLSDKHLDNKLNC